MNIIIYFQLQQLLTLGRVEIQYSKTSKSAYFDTMKEFKKDGDQLIVVYNGENFGYGAAAKALNHKSYFNDLF